MHENELRRQIAELVADHAEQAVPPSVAAIRRRGRRRRADQTSGAVLLLVAVVAGLVAVQQPLGRQLTPAPVVTLPPRTVQQPQPTPPPRPLEMTQPALSFAEDIQAQLDATLVDMTVVVLDRGKLRGGQVWQLAAVRGSGRRSHQPKECLASRLDSPGHHYGFKCLGEDTNRTLARMTLDGGLHKMPRWGLAPQGTARVVLLGPKGTTPIEVPAKTIEPGFQRSYYLAPWNERIRTAVALDGQGHEIAHYP
jgi:hypothetical protein